MTVKSCSSPRRCSKRRASLIIGRPGPCWISRSTGLDASAPRMRIHCVVPPARIASRESIAIFVPGTATRSPVSRPGQWLGLQPRPGHPPAGSPGSPAHPAPNLPAPPGRLPGPAPSCAGRGATRHLARRAVEPSTMSLLGLVRHMAEVERAWFRRRFAGNDVPKRYQTEADPDGDFNEAVADPAVVEEAWAAWREEIAFAEKFTRDHDLDFIGCDSEGEPGSLRELLGRMVEG